MKNTIKLYYMLCPFSERRVTYLCCLFGMAMGVMLLSVTSSNKDGATLSLLGFAYCCYFLFLVLINDFRVFSDRKRTSLSLLMHQFPKQYNIYKKGVIAYVGVTSAIYITIQLVLFGIFALFVPMDSRIIVLCIWASTLTGLYGILVVFAQISAKKVLGCILTGIYICIFIACIVRGELPLDFLSFYQPTSLFLLIPIMFVVLPIFSIYGKYCYRTRHELNEKMRFKRLH
ncbi:hypothetical protein [Amedibacillus sp. YH-ame10]